MIYAYLIPLEGNTIHCFFFSDCSLTDQERMIGKILALVCSVEESNSDAAVDTDDCANLLEFEDGEWVIINIHGEYMGGSSTDVRLWFY